MRLHRGLCALACLLCVAVLGACGGGDDETTTGADAGEARSRPAPPKSAFPSAEGKTLKGVLDAVQDGPSELVVSPAALAFFQGKNRYPFGVFRRDRTQVPDAEVALYVARVPRKPGARSAPGKKGAVAKAQERALEMPAVGPFPAAIESLETQPAFRAKTTTDDPDAATVVYSTELDFPSKGEWRIAAVVRHDGKVGAALLSSAVVGGAEGIPRPGEKAPRIHTPTVEDAAGDISQITTRIPPDTQNRVDYADVLGKEPIVLLFATPQFCQSRVCGPVVDVTEQVKERYGDEAAFIHMEIYEDNEPPDVRPQVRAFHLSSEPWLFVIDRKGVVRGSAEGAFGVPLVTREVKRVVGG